jgi:hypothetical protein
MGQAIIPPIAVSDAVKRSRGPQSHFLSSLIAQGSRSLFLSLAAFRSINTLLFACGENKEEKRMMGKGNLAGNEPMADPEDFGV